MTTTETDRRLEVKWSRKSTKRLETMTNRINLKPLLPHISRRVVLETLAGLGIGSAVFCRAVAAQVQTAGAVTGEMIQQAEWISGLELKPEERDMVARGLTRALASFEQLRAVKLDNSIAPAIVFNPAPSQPPPAGNPRGHFELTESAAPQRPAADDDLAFLPVSALAALLRTRQVSSVELTKLYLEQAAKVRSGFEVRHHLHR